HHRCRRPWPCSGITRPERTRSLGTSNGVTGVVWFRICGVSVMEPIIVPSVVTIHRRCFTPSKNRKSGRKLGWLKARRSAGTGHAPILLGTKHHRSLFRDVWLRREQRIVSSDQAKVPRRRTHRGELMVASLTL